MDDKTLLVRAAKAAGIELRHVEIKNVAFQGDDRFIGYMTEIEQWPRGWFNPLLDDGDALRLAVKLHLDINFYPHSEEVGAVKHRCQETYHREFARVVSGDWATATRRAIVRAAAALAKD